MSLEAFRKSLEAHLRAQAREAKARALSSEPVLISAPSLTDGNQLMARVLRDYAAIKRMGVTEAPLRTEPAKPQLDGLNGDGHREFRASHSNGHQGFGAKSVKLVVERPPDNSVSNGIHGKNGTDGKAATPEPEFQGVWIKEHETDVKIGGESFADLYERYKDRIYKCAYRLTGNQEDANDLAQEAFTLALAYAGTKPEQVNAGDFKIGPWLYRIITNKCMDQLRRRKLAKWEPIDNLLGVFSPRIIAKDDPEREVLRRETREMVHRVLEQLPPKYRACLVLREYQEMPCAEIAEVLGTTRSAVKSLLFRAREEYRKVNARVNPEG